MKVLSKMTDVTTEAALVLKRKTSFHWVKHSSHEILLGGIFIRGVLILLIIPLLRVNSLRAGKKEWKLQC